MVATQPGWQVKGIYHETCASEGHCPYYFGRDKEGGCRYFMVFRVTEGVVGGVDLAGITAVYMGDLPYPTFAEVTVKGLPRRRLYQRRGHPGAARCTRHLRGSGSGRRPDEGLLGSPLRAHRGDRRRRNGAKFGCRPAR